MLSADKDLLLAKLNQDLLSLHLLELNTVLNRFQNTIAISSLVGGFAFAAIIEVELNENEEEERRMKERYVAEGIFFTSASLTLALAMFAMAVSTYAAILGTPALSQLSAPSVRGPGESSHLCSGRAAALRIRTTAHRGHAGHSSGARQSGCGGRVCAPL